MIKDVHEANKSVKPNDFELARLRAALPEYFDKDGGFMLDRLQETLREGEVNLTREGYELKFLGKSYAKYLTSTRTETVIVPDLEHNAEAYTSLGIISMRSSTCWGPTRARSSAFTSIRRTTLVLMASSTSTTSASRQRTWSKKWVLMGTRPRG